MLTCWTCGKTVAFADCGWAHLEPAPECRRLIVLWPPALTGDDGDRD